MTKTFKFGLKTIFFYVIRERTAQTWTDMIHSLTHADLMYYFVALTSIFSSLHTHVYGTNSGSTFSTTFGTQIFDWSAPLRRQARELHHLDRVVDRHTLRGLTTCQRTPAVSNRCPYTDDRHTKQRGWIMTHGVKKVFELQKQNRWRWYLYVMGVYLLTYLLASRIEVTYFCFKCTLPRQIGDLKYISITNLWTKI